MRTSLRDSTGRTGGSPEIERPRAVSECGTNDLEEPLAGEERPTSMIFVPQDTRRFQAAMSGEQNTGMFLPLSIPMPSSLIFLPLRIILCVLALPFIGSFLAVFALREKLGGRLIGNNESDWRLLLFAGIGHQIALAPVVYVLTFPPPDGFPAVSGDGPDGSLHNTPLAVDYYGSLVWYMFVTLYLLFISAVFHQSKADGTAALSLRRLREAKSRVNALQLLERLRRSTRSPSDLVIVLAASLGIVETVLFRLCLHDSFCPRGSNGQNIDDLSYFTAYGKSPVFWIMTASWFVTLTVVNTLSMYGLMLYFQQLREVEEFTYLHKHANSSKERNGIGRPLLQDLNDFSKDVAVWTHVYHELMLSIKNRAIVKAFFVPTTVMIVFTFAGSVFYLAVEQIYNSGHRERSTMVSVVGATYSVFVCGAYIWLTVRLQRAINFHSASIGAALNDLQRQMSEQRHELDRSQLLQMESSVRVLQSLGVYLGVADNNPKLLGLSLDSFRWAVILTGLLSMNMFFFWLYERNCRHA